MYAGLIVSLLLHTALLGFAVVSITSTPPRVPAPPEPVAVDMITPSELTRITQGSREAKLKVASPKEAPKAPPQPKEAERPRPSSAAAPPPPPPPPEPAPPVPPAAAPPEPLPPPPSAPPAPVPDKAALEQKLADLAREQAAEAERQRAAEQKAREEAAARAKAEAEAKRQADLKRKAEEKRKADAKRRAEAKRKEDERKRREAEAKSKLDTDRLSALLDKAPNPRAPASAPHTDPQATQKGPVLGAPEGQDNQLSASEKAFLIGLFRQAVSRCWNINAGLEGIDKIVVRVEVRLNRDGSISGQPRVVNATSSPLFRDAADSAMRALVQCAPYTLPPDKYEGGWEHVVLTFDPQRMF